MINNSRFSVAIHSLMMLAAFQGQQKITSGTIARSTGMNAVTIRHVFTRLKAAGLIDVRPGPGGAKLAAEPEAITLYSIYAAIEDVPFSDLFHFSQNNSEWCLVGRNINDILTGRLQDVAGLVRSHLDSVTLRDLLDDLYRIEPDAPILPSD
ncbi:MAG: Rrf2 family transcriptional regulator [Clostridiales Family XIII bacterium]|jgi:DNA-binding IscR family transcriptional regulator|nr:Rrf2 family transcriptional regulator [Clostridiales Family XIII bacterium]